MKGFVKNMKFIRGIGALLVGISALMLSGAFDFDCVGACSCNEPTTDSWEVVVKEIKVDGKTIYSRSSALDLIKTEYEKAVDVCNGTRSYYDDACQDGKKNYFIKKAEFSSLLPDDFSDFTNCELSAGHSNQNFVRCLTEEPNFYSVISAYTEARE